MDHRAAAGELRSGDLIVVRLRVQGTRGEYLLMEDPIPAGCEQIERTSGIDLNYSEGNWRTGTATREFRDQRTAHLPATSSTATRLSSMRCAYRCRASSVFAPARAEFMYQPSVQANTASSSMTILDRR